MRCCGSFSTILYFNRVFSQRTPTLVRHKTPLIRPSIYCPSKASSIFFCTPRHQSGDSGNRCAKREQGALLSSLAGKLTSSISFEKLKEYGAGGLIIYSVIHFIGFLLTLVLLIFCKDTLLRFLHKLLPNYINPTEEKGFASLILIAILINKLFGPLHILMTVMLAPRFAQRAHAVCEKIIPRIKRG